MASIQSRMINRSLKRMVQGCFTEGLKLERLRKDDFRVPSPSVRKRCLPEPFSHDNIEGTWLHPGKKNKGNANKTILYFHGGAYVSGPSILHWRMLCHICCDSGYDGLLVNYRLAPEHPYPAGLSDMESAYEYLLKKRDSGDIVFMGDSAGGGLALALAMKLRDDGKPLPRKLVLLSPWLSHEMEGPETESQTGLDNMLALPGLRHASAYYRSGENLKNPYISPIFGDLKNLPPAFLMTGTLELLLPDCREFRLKAEKEGMDLVYEEWEDMFHVWMLNVPYLPEARTAVSRLVSWI